MRTSLVTGANRGIGFEVVRQLGSRGHRVLLGARNVDAGQEAASSLRSEGHDVTAVELDVSDDGSVEAAAAEIRSHTDVLDVLINSAAIDYDTGQRATAADLDRVHRALETNVFGAWRTTLSVLPLLRKSDAARIVNVSSGAGSLSEMGAGLAGYNLSKAALNALTRMWADELSPEGTLVNSVCPGWVATEMGGSGGRPIADGAAGVVWAATLPDDGPTGGFFRDGVPIPW